MFSFAEKGRGQLGLCLPLPKRRRFHGAAVKGAGIHNSCTDVLTGFHTATPPPAHQQEVRRIFCRPPVCNSLGGQCHGLCVSRDSCWLTAKMHPGMHSLHERASRLFMTRRSKMRERDELQTLQPSLPAA